MPRIINRRRFMLGAAAAGGSLVSSAWLPAWAQPFSSGITAPVTTLSGDEIALRIAYQTIMIDGQPSRAIGINGTVPAPLIRLREGQTVRLRVINDLDNEDSSIHWHGLLVPAAMDGVPGVSFPGIPPKSSFLYEFPVKQSGTYWYHSHSGLQEQLGHYGPIVIDPAGPDPVAFDREHVVVLSDHSQTAPETIFRKLKQQSGYYNYHKQTLAGLIAGKDQPVSDRLSWAGMRMDPTDIADVTGAAYSYLVNGHGPQDNWTGLFTPGERVRLRIINASSMTTFNVRIPGLPVTIVQADGNNVRPVEVEEFQIGSAETYDVIVTPPTDSAYTLVGENIDRSGMARATLAPRAGMSAEMPPLRSRPLATMTDMGMDGGSMEMDMDMRNPKNAPGVAMTPGVQTISPMAKDRTGEPGQGLEDVTHKVLTYRDLVVLDRNPDLRAPSRSLDIHLTGNMERFMWAFDGVKMSDSMVPIPFLKDERVRVTLINDTMMGHPIHLHGHFFELVTGQGDHAPRKHTVMVQPGGKVTFDLTAGAVGDWVLHCHLLYHMHAGMMRIVSVREPGGI